jgi:hypothetical protein
MGVSGENLISVVDPALCPVEIEETDSKVLEV